MIKMLIADDESLVCVGLKSMLDWDALGIDIVGTARNGEQASKMIGELRPDIVISDIRMPLKSGLELLEETYEKYGRSILFIMLTSYEDFNYAQKAMKYRAVDYLVKLELTPEELRASVNRAVTILKEQKALNKISKNVVIDKRLKKENFFIRLYNGLFDDEQQMQQVQGEAEITFNGYAYAAAIFEIVEEGGAKLPENAAIRGNVINMVEETINRTMPCYLSTSEANFFDATFCFGERDPLKHKEIMESTLEKTIDMIKNYFNISLRIGVGHVVATPIELCDSYRSAKRVSANLSEDSPLFFMERQNYAHYLVDQVKEYIQGNLDKKLSQNDVAAEFHLSSGYLSQLFSRHAETGFVEYITSTRINAAKDLLLEDSRRINEIAELLGFESAFYFSNVFKRIEGVSPREWRKKNSGKSTKEESKND